MIDNVNLFLENDVDRGQSSIYSVHIWDSNSIANSVDDSVEFVEESLDDSDSLLLDTVPSFTVE